MRFEENARIIYSAEDVRELIREDAKARCLTPHGWEIDKVYLYTDGALIELSRSAK